MQDYAPFIATIEHTLDSDVAKIIKSLLVVGGFEFDKKDGVFNASPAAVEATFGASTTRGGFNPLKKVYTFTVRQIESSKLFSTSSKMYSPATTSDTKMYTLANAELDGAELDGAGKMKPAYILRNMITEAWADGVKPDWRVRAIACVRPDREFSVRFKPRTMKQDGVQCAECATMVMRFAWQSRSRQQPGNTYPKPLFASLN